jgi:hypothetical protein
MTKVVYRPDDPRSNDNGMLDASLAYEPYTGPGFHVISDEMNATRNMADGRYYTSKHKFREATKAMGCIEVGNDPAINRPRKPIPIDRAKRRDDIRRTIYELRNGIKRHGD